MSGNPPPPPNILLFTLDTLLLEVKNKQTLQHGCWVLTNHVCCSNQNINVSTCTVVPAI